MDKNRSSRLTGLISKLTIAANKAVKKEKEVRKHTQRFTRTEFQVPLRLTPIEQNLRTS